MPMQAEGTGMTGECMMGQGMMWIMGIGSIILLVLVALSIAALVKYVFFR